MRTARAAVSSAPPRSKSSTGSALSNFKRDGSRLVCPAAELKTFGSRPDRERHPAVETCSRRSWRRHGMLKTQARRLEKGIDRCNVWFWHCGSSPRLVRSDVRARAFQAVRPRARERLGIGLRPRNLSKYYTLSRTGRTEPSRTLDCYLPAERYMAPHIGAAIPTMAARYIKSRRAENTPSYIGLFGMRRLVSARIPTVAS